MTNSFAATAAGCAFFLILFICAPVIAEANCDDLVAVGDLITSGDQAPITYPKLIASALGSHWINEGVSGAGWGGLAARAQTRVDPRAKQIGCTSPYLILFAGTNDIANGVPTKMTFDGFVAYLKARISSGWDRRRIVVVTMLPRIHVSEAKRSEFNSFLVSGASTFGYSLARIDLDPSLGCSSCETNKEFYVDGIHPNALGEQILASVICRSMNGVPFASCPQRPH